MKNNKECVNCGQPAVAGSTLCMDCLVALIGKQGDLVRENKVLRDTLSLNRKLLSVVTKKYQYLKDVIGVNKKEGER